MTKVQRACESSSRNGIRGRSARPWLPIFGLMFLALTLCAFAAEATEKNVLVLESFSNHSEPVDSLKSELRARASWPVNFYVEYLEGRRFDDEGYEKTEFEMLKHTYLGRKLDIVIARASPALQFALRHRDELFPGVPIVFWDVDVNRIGPRMPGVTGVTISLDVRGTLDLALHLHPDTNTVAVITENSEFEKYWLAAVRAELFRRRDKVQEIDLVGLPTSQLLARVAALPRRTIVLFQEAPQRSIQPEMGTYDLLAWVGQRLPTYCILPELCLGHGGIGGVGADVFTGVSPLAAALAKRVLSGEPPENIPFVDGTVQQVRVDWRQLRRWNIAESKLPAGSLVFYRQPNFAQRNRRYIMAAIVVVAVQSLLIMGFWWQRTRNRKAEAKLRESEKRFRVMADTTPGLIWMCDPEGKIIFLNERRLAFTGPEPNGGCGDMWTEYVHPDDRNTVLNAFTRSLKSHQPFSKEYRLRRHDGVYRWLFDVVTPRANGDGSFAGFIGWAIDITDQKLAQAAFEKVSGRLIDAQERERSRIARDLHDDISQKLALLSIELEQANQSTDGLPASSKARFEEIQKRCSEIANDVQSLSHRLHYSNLDYLGIVAAIRSLCRDLAKHRRVSIAFRDESVPEHLPKDVALCLFRVVQEALQNAVKHSKVRQFSVELRATNDGLQLEVSDAGVGFDMKEAMRHPGLGLVSMQERVHLLNGRFSLESRPGEGTKIIATVPVIPDEARAQAERNQTASVEGAA
jgi:PAS domain S-box-containing protein